MSVPAALLLHWFSCNADAWGPAAALLLVVWVHIVMATPFRISTFHDCCVHCSQADVTWFFSDSIFVFHGDIDLDWGIPIKLEKTWARGLAGYVL